MLEINLTYFYTICDKTNEFHILWDGLLYWYSLRAKLERKR